MNARGAGALIALAPLLLARLIAQPAAAPATAPAAADDEIRPTVTVESGDVGGKYFGHTPDPQRTRHYYVTAEAEQWDYAPSGRDAVHGGPLPPAVRAERKSSKLRYQQYTDATFRTRVFANPSLGVLGPVFRGVVGEWLAITFLNRTAQPLSLHPHGVRYDKDSEGAYYQPSPGRGAAVGPGATFTYVWHLDENSGPLPTEPSSKAWLYHSHVHDADETNAGLIGFIIVTDPKRARPDGTPVDVDREFGTLFFTFDESGLGVEAKEAAEYANLPGAASAPLTWTQMQAQLQTGARHAINGRVFGHLPGLEMNQGERVRWYLFGLGDERDNHSAHWLGERVVADGRLTSTVDLLPASMKVADLAADLAGDWLLECGVATHANAGSIARFTVHPRDAMGADRTPARAFLGLPAAAQSLRITRAEATSSVNSATVALAGEVTVFEAFAVFNQTLQLQLGRRTVSFHPDAQGHATADGDTLRIKNVGSVGVIYGGALEFEITLTGPDWLLVLRELGLASSTKELNAPLTLRLGPAEHHATARLAMRTP